MNTRKVTFRMTVICCLAILSALPVLGAGQVVNINSADAETLSLLPRVGPTVAQRIIDFREENGGFQAKQDLLLVKGIGERTYEQIEPYIALEGESTLSEKVRTSRPAEKQEKQGN